MTSASPFVLIDDARDGGRAWLYADPVEIVETRDPGEVRACLAKLRGRHAAGFFGYEAGYAFEDKLKPFAASPAEDAPPLLWFGLFDAPVPVDPLDFLPDGAGAWAGPPRPLIAEADYRPALATVLEHIAAGDIYQANLTFQAEAKIAGDPRALYAAIRALSLIHI